MGFNGQDAYFPQSDSPESLNRMSWQEFEHLVSEAFRLDGFRVEERGGEEVRADGGIDLVLFRDREKFLVQCKQWKATRVSVNVVRELFGVMAAEGAAGGFVVTSGTFTPDARAFAEGRNVILVDGPILFDMILRVRVSTTSNARVSPSRDARASADGVPAFSAHGALGEVVHCPVCNSPMVKRTARRGANAGGEFWGCSRYPGCKGVRA